MDELREGVGLQAYAQKDPLVVYKTQGTVLPAAPGKYPTRRGAHDLPGAAGRRAAAGADASH